jgi:hypothetical protein
MLQQRTLFDTWWDTLGQVKKQIKILDHRLEKALAKHNHTLASNKRLREGIDNMRRERIVFAQVRACPPPPPCPSQQGECAGRGE